MTSTRTDAHSPARLVTEDYEPRGAYDRGSSDVRPVYHFDRETVLPLLCGAYGDDLDHCDHCGAGIRYGAILLHTPTGGYIHVGETCLDRFDLTTNEFQAMRKAAADERGLGRIRAAWETYKDEHQAPWAELHASENAFVQDVLAKGRRYGNLSDRQLEAICDAIAPKAPEVEAAKVPVPEGRQTVTGRVVSVKLQDGYMGDVLKMLVCVETPEGEFRVWGSVPSALLQTIVDHSGSYRMANGGMTGPKYRTCATVSFTATIERSSKDESFGFFKRPTKASVVEAAA